MTVPAYLDYENGPCMNQSMWFLKHAKMNTSESNPCQCTPESFTNYCNCVFVSMKADRVTIADHLTNCRTINRKPLIYSFKVEVHTRHSC